MLRLDISRNPDLMSQDHSYEQSVTNWIHGLQEGNEEALEKLWERYFHRLTELAKGKLRNIPTRVSDEEDIALNVLYALSDGAAAGKFDELKNRDELWRLLVAMTSCRVVDQIRGQTAQKQGGGQVRGDSVMDHGDIAGGFDRFISTDPSPDFLASLEEETQGLFELLPDDTQRQIAKYRLEGYTNEEIGEKLGMSSRTVERKLVLIRMAWEKRL